MITSTIIRDATFDDLPARERLMCGLGYLNTIEEMKVRFENISGHPDYKTFLATNGESVIGMAGTVINHFYELNGKYVRIVAFVIDKSYRKKGIGKLLLQAVESWAKEIGATTVVLNCGMREERRDAHEFYKNNGYLPKSTGYSKKI